MLVLVKRLCCGVGAALAFAMASPALAADAVAMVTDVKGNVAISGDSGAEKLRLLAYLLPGQEIALEKDAKLVITFFSKPQEYTFSGPAKLTITADAPHLVEGRAAQSRTVGSSGTDTARRFTRMQRERLAQATFEMRGAMPGVRLVGPVDTLLLSTTPEFAWFGPNEAKAYQFTLLGEQGEVLQSFATDKTYWRVPVASPLKRERSYRWKVEATLPSGETLSAGGSFNVLGEDRAKLLIAAQPDANAGFPERVLYAARLETEGLKYEAKTEWQLLSKERPDDLVLQEQAVR